MITHTDTHKAVYIHKTNPLLSRRLCTNTQILACYLRGEEKKRERERFPLFLNLVLLVVSLLPLPDFDGIEPKHPGHEDASAKVKLGHHARVRGDQIAKDVSEALPQPIVTEGSF